MAFMHGKDTVVTIDGTDISAFTNSTSFEDSTDSHETTTYGRQRKTYSSGLGDGTITIGGTSDDSASGPRAVIKPLKAAGAAVPFVYQPAGAGSGKPQSTVDVIVTAYNESSPVAEMAQWTAELQMTGEINDDPQA